jgi:hypothetical protein
MNTLILATLIAFVSSAPNAGGTIVTPYLTVDGYSAKTWDANPAGGCTSNSETMNRAFPNGMICVTPTLSADINQWTGEVKLDAIHRVAEKYNYMVIARFA